MLWSKESSQKVKRRVYFLKFDEHGFFDKISYFLNKTKEKYDEFLCTSDLS